MKETFVNNIEQLMTANQNQRIKINYLQADKQKRQEYLSGLRESIMLNKQTMIVLNQQGPNDPAIAFTTKQNLHLIKLNDQLYNQNRQLNALLLMEKQLRVEDKAFYIQRIAQFENRITDLRKYLHDKQESFSAVVLRLKKYEEWGQKPLSQKIQDTQGLRKLTNQILQKVLIERNIFKAKFQAVLESSHKYNVLESALKNGGGNLSRLITQLEVKNYGTQQELEDNKTKKAFSQNETPRKQLVKHYKKNNEKQRMKRQQQVQKNTSNFKQTPITKQLMRLLKKQKLNNQILQSALHEAIQKNEELIKINQNLQVGFGILQKKMQKLIAQNYLLRQKIKEFSRGGYGRKYQIDRARDDRDQPGYMKLFSINFEIKDEDDDPVPARHYKDLLKQSLKQDIQKLLKIPILKQSYVLKSGKQTDLEEKIISEQMTTNDMSRLNQKIVSSKGKVQHIAIVGKGENSNTVMIKSASEPRIVMQWQTEIEANLQNDHQAEEIVVDEF